MELGGDGDGILTLAEGKNDVCECGIFGFTVPERSVGPFGRHGQCVSHQLETNCVLAAASLEACLLHYTTLRYCTVP